MFMLGIRLATGCANWAGIGIFHVRDTVGCPLGFCHALRGWENLRFDSGWTIGVIGYHLGADDGISE